MDRRRRDGSRVSKRFDRSVEFGFSSSLPLEVPSSGVLSELFLKEGFEDSNSLFGNDREGTERAEDFDRVDDEAKRFFSVRVFAGGVRELEDLGERRTKKGGLEDSLDGKEGRDRLTKITAAATECVRFVQVFLNGSRSHSLRIWRIRLA